jgi:hypothetical protein
MEDAELRLLMRDRVGIRIGHEMGKYLLAKFGESKGNVAVIGSDARTGLPRREVVDLRALRA